MMMPSFVRKENKHLSSCQCCLHSSVLIRSWPASETVVGHLKVIIASGLLLEVFSYSYTVEYGGLGGQCEGKKESDNPLSKSDLKNYFICFICLLKSKWKRFCQDNLSKSHTFFHLWNFCQVEKKVLDQIK